MAAKTFCFQEYDAIGVDLDHTICKYKLDAIFPLIYESLAKVLVNDHGYSKELLEPFDKNKDFLTKGLVLDVINGNFLKLSGAGIVLRATHGTKPLTEGEIIEYYGKDRLWQHSAELKENLKQTDCVRYFENYFDMPAAVLFARLIDLKDKETGKKQAKYSLSTHMIDALNKVFGREHFQDGTGGYFSTIRADPSKFFQKCSDITKKWLRNLKAHGKVVFLQTSSNVDYAMMLLEYILGSDWESYFDLCIMYARKPGCYLAKTPTERPFYTIKNLKEDNPVLEIGSEKCYLQGNIHSLNEYLQKTTGKDKPKVVYVGDSLRSDVWPTNKYAGWASILVLEEMEAEGLVDETVSDEESSSDEDEGHEGPPAKLAKMKHPSKREQEFLVSSVWGSFFVDSKPTVNNNPPAQQSKDAPDSSEKSTELVDSLWGHFMKKYSTIAVPTVEHVAVFHIDHEFKTFANDDSGTAGFYPSMPRACKQ